MDFIRLRLIMKKNDVNLVVFEIANYLLLEEKKK